MLNSKQKQLFEVKQTTSVTTSTFVASAIKESSKTLSNNGALKYSSTGNDFVDQFGKLGEYKAPRSYANISSDMSVLWANNPKLAICFLFFIRMITRVTSLFDGSKTNTVQRGSGLKHEGIMRMMWLHINHSEVFWKNIHLYISVGSWKDIIQLLSYDLQYNGWKGRMLNWDNFGKLILAGLENPKTSELVKKYLPQIKSNSNCKTLESQADNLISKWICSLLFGSKESSNNYKKYRQLKTSGTAHQWQQLISQSKHNLIDFNTVHGRALALMVSGKYLANQGLEVKYEEWIANKPIAKFTGYVNELFTKLPQKKYQIDTLNAQFKGLVETAKTGAIQNTSMIVVRDTSHSMTSACTGTTQSAYDVAKALALFFSEMLPNGAFANSWIEFKDKAVMHLWKGSTPYEKWNNDHTSTIGSTNFQSVIDLFCTLKTQGISENEFPTGIICISDSEFNPTQLDKTNVEVALHKLFVTGFSDNYIKNFKIVLWNLRTSTGGNKFETHGNVDNVYYFSGYDGSIVAFLTGVEGQTSTPKNAEELFQAAISQEIMQMIEI